MRLAKKPMTIAQARKALDRAKLRGRVDEIQRASGQLAGARSHERAEVRRAVDRTIQAVFTQAAAIAAQPAGLTPAQRGAQTRKLRRLERQALEARVRAERELPQPKAPDPRIDILVDAWRRLQPGRDAFGNSYTIIDPCGREDSTVFWYGCDVAVSIQDGGPVAEYRWTGRTLSAVDAAGDMQAMRDSYSRKTVAPPSQKAVSPCEMWQSFREWSLKMAKKGLGFEILVAMVRQ